LDSNCCRRRLRAQTPRRQFQEEIARLKQQLAARQAAGGGGGGGGVPEGAGAGVQVAMAALWSWQAA
jgi:hypothetical protein